MKRCALPRTRARAVRARDPLRYFPLEVALGLNPLGRACSIRTLGSGGRRAKHTATVKPCLAERRRCRSPMLSYVRRGLPRATAGAGARAEAIPPFSDCE